MKCRNCNEEMKKVKMITHMASTPFLQYQKGIWDSERRSPVDTWVCPQCGYVELQALNPEVFKDI